MKNAERFGPFLVALGALSTEHGVVIRGCGCCGSPWMDHEVEPGSVVGYRMDEDGTDMRPVITPAEEIE